MTKIALLLSTTMLCICGTLSAYAQAAPSESGTPTSTPNDNNNYRSDRLLWTTAIEASETPGGPPVYCIPAGTVVIGLSSTLEGAPVNTTTGTQGSGGQVNSTISTHWLKVRLAEQGFPYVDHIATPEDDIQGDWTHDHGYVGPAQAPGQCTALANSKRTKADGTPVDGKLYEGQAVYISDGDLQDVDHRVGWEYGALLIPFKLQLSKGKALTGATSVGAYLGFRIPLLNIVFSPVVFAGASTIAVSTTTDNKTSTQNLAGLSYGGGLIFSIKDSFQTGVIIGADHVNTDANYQYNNKPWISFEIGYSFAQ